MYPTIYQAVEDCRAAAAQYAPYRKPVDGRYFTGNTDVAWVECRGKETWRPVQ
jgi:hypothetical protein